MYDVTRMTLVTLKNLQFEMNLGTIKKWKIRKLGQMERQKNKSETMCVYCKRQNSFFFRNFFFWVGLRGTPDRVTNRSKLISVYFFWFKAWNAPIVACIFFIRNEISVWKFQNFCVLGWFSRVVQKPFLAFPPNYNCGISIFVWVNTV